MEAISSTTAGPGPAASAADAAPPSAVRRLRAATRERHERLEAIPSQRRLLAEDYQPTEYRLLLQRFYGFYAPLGAALGHEAAWGARVTERASLLARDLRDFGATSADLSALARCEKLPLLDSHDRVLGCAYVVEGATLGGRVIVKHLERTFGTPGSPTRFFAGDGERTAARWQQSCATVNAEVEDFGELCRAACATFDAMADWLANPAAPEAARAC